jgi:hypothetical protein
MEDGQRKYRLNTIQEESMRPTGLLVKIMIIGFLVGSTGLAGGMVAAAHVTATGSSGCAKVAVVAKPRLNTQAGSTETIQNQITNCTGQTEVVQVKQKLSAQLTGAFTGTFTLAKHQTVEITQHIPYVCCGMYHATDQVFSTSGQLLATGRGSWTFA